MQNQLPQLSKGDGSSHSLLLEAASYIEEASSFAPDWSASLVSRLRVEEEAKAEAAELRAQVRAQGTPTEPPSKAAFDSLILVNEDLQVVLAALTLLQETRQQERDRLELPPLPFQDGQALPDADTRDGEILRAGRLHLTLSAEVLRRKTSRHNAERDATTAEKLTATEE